MIVGSQVTFATFSSQAAQSPLILVGSILIVAALSQPLRHGIQRTIDRRFYRRKYDAARTIAAFSASLRQEVDLDQLHEQLLAIVQETMQPASISLWIRPLKHEITSEGLREELSHVEKSSQEQTAPTRGKLASCGSARMRLKGVGGAQEGCYGFLSCIMATQFLPGSMNQAIQAKPISAMPSWVCNPGRS
jgi:hypothetical protein